jgi:uncharacterized SAM-binding protein YcdF (DUF218 family)
MKWFIGAALLLIGLIVGTSIYLQPNDFIGCHDQPVLGGDTCQPADAIVVVSGGDTSARTAEAIKLFQNGWADSLVVAGAAEDKSGPSNAEVMKQQALMAGVPYQAIRVEELSETTEQNAANTQTIFANEGYEEVILVTSGYHQRRASLEFNRQAGSDVIILNHPLMSDKDWSIWWWLTPKGWWFAGGEIIKIIAFYVQGAVR